MEKWEKNNTRAAHTEVLLSLVIGTAVLLVAYWVVIEHFMTGGGVMLLVAVLLGIVWNNSFYPRHCPAFKYSSCF